MRRSPYFFASVAAVVLAVFAAGSGVIAWVNRPAAQEARLAHAVSAATGVHIEHFTQAAFQQAQAAGDPILIAIHARWCPTCAAQTPIIQKIAAEGDTKNLRVLLVDFDTQKDVVKQFGATMQSTLVMFHGKDEMARTVGDTDANSIRSSIRRTLI
jgi:thioredoxin-like negative regulator of GroEL